MKTKENLIILVVFLGVFAVTACDNKTKRTSFQGGSNGSPAVDNTGSTGTSDAQATETTTTTSTSTVISSSSTGICLDTGEVNPEILSALIAYIPTGITFIKPLLLEKVDVAAEKVLAENMLNFLSTHASDILLGTNTDLIVNDFATIITQFKSDISADMLSNIKLGLKAALEAIPTILKKECKFTDTKQLVSAIMSDLVKVIPAELSVKFMSYITDDKINEIISSLSN